MMRRLRDRWKWLLIVAAVFVAWVVLHLPVTDATDWLVGRVGFNRYDQTMRTAAGVVTAAMFVTLWKRERGPLSQRAASLGSTALLALAVIAQRWLTIAPVEFVHYPQYGVVGYLLARGIAGEPAWIGATVLGAIDEAHQFLFLRRGRPDYFDWNDVCLNAVGAAFGVVLAVTAKPIGSRLSLSTRSMVAVCTVIAASAFALDPPVWSPYLTGTPRGANWRILSAGEGVVFVAVVWLVTRLTIASVRRPQTEASDGGRTLERSSDGKSNQLF